MVMDVVVFVSVTGQFRRENTRFGYTKHHCI